MAVGKSVCVNLSLEGEGDRTNIKFSLSENE